MLERWEAWWLTQWSQKNPELPCHTLVVTEYQGCGLRGSPSAMGLPRAVRVPAKRRRRPVPTWGSDKSVRRKHSDEEEQALH